MNNIFLDSNICVYACDNSNTNKQSIAFTLLQNTPNISSQVIIETYNACHKKLKINELICQQMVSNLLSITNVCNIDSNVIIKALFVKEKYKFSFLDCLIIATALQNFCTILYTEDLHHNLVVEGKLTIVNPFLLQ